MKKLYEIIDENGLETKIRRYSMALDESDQNSRSLILTIWKDGNASVALVQSENFFDDETEKQIEEQISLPRVLIYDDYDVGEALKDGVSEDDIQNDAVERYIDNFDLREYLKLAHLEEE